VSSTEALSCNLACTCSNEIEALKACEVKTACTEWFWTLFDPKNFVLPNLMVQEVEINREHEDEGEMVGYYLVHKV